jgi:ribonuclease HI
LNTVIDIEYEIKIEGMEHNKSTYSEHELKAHTLRYIHSRYPTGAWVQVYTDGSATPGKGSAGAGIYCNLFEKSIAAGKYGSNFDGEVMVIWQALKELNKQHLARKNVVLLIDSVAAIQAVDNNEESQDKKIILARYKIKSLQTKGVKVMLQWVPSHCGLLGNKKADYLAKLGSHKKTPNRISFHSAKTHIKAAVRSQVKNKWNTESKEQDWETLIKRNSESAQK